MAAIISHQGTGRASQTNHMTNPGSVQCVCVCRCTAVAAGHIDQYSFTKTDLQLEFLFVTKRTKTARSGHCHLLFARAAANKLLALGHKRQWATPCQLSLKATRINGPKISFKITIFCILVAGCQLSSGSEISDLSVQLIFNLLLTPGFSRPLACANNKICFTVIQINKKLLRPCPPLPPHPIPLSSFEEERGRECAERGEGGEEEKGGKRVQKDSALIQ